MQEAHATSKAEISLQNAKQNAKTWHKLLGIRRVDDRVLVTVVRGLSLGDDPQVLADEMIYTASEELDCFLGSPQIQAKLFNPDKRGIVLIDVAGYSQFDTRGQSAILTTLHEGLQLAQRSNDLFSPDSSVDQIIPTGDGCYIVFKPDVTDHVLQSVFSIHASFYCHQRRLLKRFDEAEITETLGIRVACHVGEVDFIIDSAGNRNAFGTGLNETARILQCGQSTLKDKLGGDDPTGVAFFEEAMDTQAKPIIGFFDRLENNDLKYHDLGKVKAKHGLELNLRCFTSLPNHIAFPFKSPLPTLKSLHPAFLTA